jgi:hypothetical protein
MSGREANVLAAATLVCAQQRLAMVIPLPLPQQLLEGVITVSERAVPITLQPEGVTVTLPLLVPTVTVTLLVPCPEVITQVLSGNVQV